MKENRDFRSYSFFLQKNNEKADKFSIKFSWKLNASVLRCLNPLFEHTFFLLPPLFQGYLNPQVRISKMINSVDYHPCSSRSASFHISLNFLGLSFSPECLLTMCGKDFQTYDVHIPRKCIESRRFYSGPLFPTQIKP